MTAILNASTTSGVVITSDNSGNIVIQSNGSNAITTAGANVTFSGTLTTAAKGITAASLPAGSVLQVVSAAITTQTSTTSGSYVATYVTANITPYSSTSKVLVSVTGPVDTGTGTNQTVLTVYRNATQLSNASTNGFTQSQRSIFPIAIIYLDSPATTSATAYTVYMLVGSSGNATFPQGTGNITLTEIAA